MFISILITQTNIYLNKAVDKIYYLLQKYTQQLLLTDATLMVYLMANYHLFFKFNFHKIFTRFIFLPPFLVSFSFLIPSQSSMYFFNTSLFSSVESKTNYLILFFSSICPSTLPIIRYEGFTL